jgi:hypothetical protein
MGIGVLGCQLDDMPTLLKDARHLAAMRRCTSVFWLAPVHESVRSALEEAGYASDWDNTAYVFEKEHPTLE